MENNNSPKDSEVSSEYYEISKKNRRIIIAIILGFIFLLSLLFASVRSFYGNLGRTVGEAIYRQKFLFTEINNDSCEGYLDYFGDKRFSDCYDCCQQLVDCEKAKETGTKEALQAYLDKYTSEETDTCRLEIMVMLDSLECKEALEAENKMEAYQAYLNTYGSAGNCSDQINKEMVACQALLTETECQPYLDYLKTNGVDALCSDSAMVFLFEKDCAVDQDLICQWLRSQTSCDVILKNIGRVDKNSSCYADLKKALQDICKYPEDEIAFFEALVSGDPTRALRSFIDSYDDSTFKAMAMNELKQKGEQLVPRSYEASTRRLPRCQTFPGGIKAVRIGELWIMQENVNSPIKSGYAYPVNTEYAQDFGRLYSWKQAHDACPKGWRLPCEQEIKYLELIYPNTYTYLADNSSCSFNASMGGYFNQDTKEFRGIGSIGAYWCATENSDKKGYAYVFDRETNSFGLSTLNKDSKLSCRCVKDYDPRKTSSAFLKLADCPNWPR